MIDQMRVDQASREHNAELRRQIASGLSHGSHDLPQARSRGDSWSHRSGSGAGPPLRPSSQVASFVATKHCLKLALHPFCCAQQGGASPTSVSAF